MLYPFSGKIGPSLRIGTLAPGRLLWSRVFENSTRDTATLYDVPVEHKAASDMTVPLRDSSLSNKLSSIGSIDDDFELDSVEYDSRGNLIGPFLISRK